MQREELQNKLEEDIFVAGILVLENKHDGLLYTVCVWPKHIPVILPKVDYVIIKKAYKKLFKDVEESGLVSYDVIMDKLNSSFETFKHDIPDLKSYRQKRPKR